MSAQTAEQIEQQARNYLEIGQAEMAEPLFAALVSVQVGEPRHWLNWAFCLIECERFEDALGVLDNLPASSFEQPLPRLARGIAALQLQYFARAVADLDRAYALDPTLLVARILQIQAVLAMENRVAAEAMLDDFPFEHPLIPHDAERLVQCLFRVHRYESAALVIKNALMYEPEHPGLLLLQAHLEERQNNVSGAERLLDRLPAVTHSSQLLRARLEGRKGRVDQALNLLEALRLSAVHSDRAADIAGIDFERGRWLDRNGCYAEAWAAYEGANRSDRERDRLRNPSRWRQTDINPALIDPQYLDPVVKSRRLRASNVPERPSPIFLVGFPRSGTTLLDNMLNSHPAITVLEEKLLLEPALATVGEMSGGYPAALEHLTSDDINQLRNTYWTEAAKYTAFADDIRLVDKYPLNLLRVPLILTLFPDAQWLFVIRHPLDVVLSCFMQRLEFSDLTKGFSDLQETAKFYDAAIRLWKNQRERLELDCIDVKYEDVVADSPSQLRRILDHFGLRWSDRVLEFDQLAKRKWVGTPSYEQVARPLYSSSVHRWRHYEPWLAPATHVLSAMIRELGYNG